MRKHQRFVLLTGILLVALGVSAWVNLPPWMQRRRAAQHYQLGLEYEREGKADRALAEWRIAADIDRDYPAPFHKLGDFLLTKADRPDLAAGNFRWLAAIEPHGPHVYCKLVQALALQNELAEARGFADVAMKAEPNCPLAHHMLGILLITDHRIAEGLPHLEKACRLAPENTTFALVLAKAYLDTSNLPKAEEVLESILRRDPARAEAHYLLGWAYNRGPRTQDAIQKATGHFQAAAHLQPDDADSYSELGKLLLQTGHPVQARVALEKALQINPRLVQAANSLIQAYHRLGQEAKAESMERQARSLMERSDHLRELRKKAEFAPDDLDITLRLAQAELDDGNLTDTMRYVQGVLTRRPADRRALGLLARVYILGGKPQMAEAVQDQLKNLPGGRTGGK
jgi:Tfp pilus assembly protein PilF